jgi:hypothetical protein
MFCYHRIIPGVRSNIVVEILELQSLILPLGCLMQQLEMLHVISVDHMTADIYTIAVSTLTLPAPVGMLLAGLPGSSHEGGGLLQMLTPS